MRRQGVSVAELESLYRERYDDFARVAAAVAGDADAGRDVVHTAFANALRRRRSFRGTGPLEGWLWRIVVNEARRAGKNATPQPLDHDEPASNGRASDEFGLRAWVAALPERQRHVLFLRYYADLDYRTIASILGVEVGTVSATLSAAHTKLRKALREVKS